jgi:hypothetical protein
MSVTEIMQSPAYRKIVEVLGMLPKHMIENAGRSCKVTCDV